MSYMPRPINPYRTNEEYIDLFFHVLDQGFERVSKYDKKVFNVIRKAILREDHTVSDKRLLNEVPRLETIIEQVKILCRDDHISRLTNKSYTRTKTCRLDPATLADMYIEYMNGEQVSKKYGVNPNTVATYISNIRHKPQYEETRSILLSKGVDLTEKRSFKKHPAKVDSENVKFTINNVSTSESSTSFRNSLLDLATTKEAVNLFVTNTAARNAFYDLLNSLN